MKPLRNSRLTGPTLRLENTTTTFYGKPITIKDALKVTDELYDYYQALKYNRSRMPKKPNQALGYLLRCNAIAKLQHTQINYGLKAGLKANYLSQEEVVWAWMYAHHGQTDRPVITLGGLQLKFESKTMVV